MQDGIFHMFENTRLCNSDPPFLYTGIHLIWSADLKTGNRNILENSHGYLWTRAPESGFRETAIGLLVCFLLWLLFASDSIQRKSCWGKMPAFRQSSCVSQSNGLGTQTPRFESSSGTCEIVRSQTRSRPSNSPFWPRDMCSFIQCSSHIKRWFVSSPYSSGGGMEAQRWMWPGSWTPLSKGARRWTQACRPVLVL